MSSPVTQRCYLLLILRSTFLQGSPFVASKVVLTKLPPLRLVPLRFFVAVLSLLAWLRLALIGLLQTAGGMAFLTMGLTQTTASEAAMVLSTHELPVHGCIE